MNKINEALEKEPAGLSAHFINEAAGLVINHPNGQVAIIDTKDAEDLCASLAKLIWKSEREKLEENAGLEWLELPVEYYDEEKGAYLSTTVGVWGKVLEENPSDREPLGEEFADIFRKEAPTGKLARLFNSLLGWLEKDKKTSGEMTLGEMDSVEPFKGK